MQIDENLYQAFLTEMNLLEHFRMSYLNTHSSAQLGREDPDVKRLIEAMAFFSARTKMSGIKNIQATRRRLFEQYFSFLLHPLPTMGILQCEITGRFAETAFLPKNSEALITTSEGEQAIVRTLMDLRVFPISLVKVETFLRAQSGTRVMLHFRTSYTRSDELKFLSLYINHLNNYPASLHVQQAIRRHLENAYIAYDDEITEIFKDTPCSVTYGLPEDPTETENRDMTHPMQKIRSFFHFPQQHLYVNFKIPARRKPWTKFAICLDLDGKWPKNLRLNQDIFQLFTIPVDNIKTSMSQPILCQGMRDRYPIRYPIPQPQYSLHSVLGVYFVEQAGLVPLKSGLFGGENGTYEIEQVIGQDKIKRSWACVNLPEAFIEEKEIAIEALWIQPWFSEKVSDRLEVVLHNRHISGVSWEFLGDLRPHEENPLVHDVDSMLQLLAMQKKPVFTLQEVQCLLKVLGSIHKSHFREILDFIKGMQVTTQHRAGNASGPNNIYLFEFKEFDTSYRARVEVFLRKLTYMLNSFCSEGIVTVKAKVASSLDEIDFE